MTRIIEIVVSKSGETTVQTRGFSGADCLQASRFLEQALGTPVSDRRTSDFYIAMPTEQHVEQ